ncbi:DNA ligase (ATP) [Handroanthus impetiginosus]|uniref:DNA ligase (ATP) n=1 Tax=Handroanthus impetiginosus TaxID=429701 RepID=A0A2G9GNC4_9LAMI|nr:DNA ligase (ATP) [Handroanthus impetiginosus]
MTGDGDEHDLSREEYHTLEVGWKDASSSCIGGTKGKVTSDRPRIVSLPNRDGKRKRGRPSGMNTRKGKSVFNQSRRTRPRVGNRAAKIYENESDKSASPDNKEDFEISSINSESPDLMKNKGRLNLVQPWKTRARIQNKPAEIGGNELDKGADSEGAQTMKEVLEVSGANHGSSETGNLIIPIPEFQKREAVKNSTSESGIAVEEQGKLRETVDEVSEVGPGQCSNTQYNDRPKDSVDPIQAMLLNMVPSLATEKAESVTPVPQEVEARNLEPTQKEEKLPSEAETQPGKKRKVSYKDVASELLKDW